MVVHHKQAEGLLIKALKDEDDIVRDQAAAALAKLGDKKAVEPLIATLDDRSYGVRQEVVEALGIRGQPKAHISSSANLGD